MLFCHLYRKNKSGFTLVEILISMVIVSFLGGVLYVTFSQGIRVWQAAVRKSKINQHEFFFEQFKSELRNAFQNGSLAMKGEKRTVEFCTFVKARSDGTESKAMQRVPVRIQYRFDPNEKVIYKEINFYEKILNPKSTRSSTGAVLGDISGVEFEYYRHSSQQLAASWVSQWNNACFPEAIKMTMDSNVLSGAKSTRIFSLPAPGNCAESEN